MQLSRCLAFSLLYLCVARSFLPVLCLNVSSTLQLSNDLSVLVSPAPNFKPKTLSRRNPDSRRVYLVFHAYRVPSTNATTSLTSPISTIKMNLQLEPGPFPGAWPFTTIQLVKTPVDYHDSMGGYTGTRQIFQLWFTQMTTDLGLPVSHLVDGQENSLGNTHLMKFYLGTTTASDNTILEPRTGTGLLLQVIRSLPQIGPSPGQTRGAFMVNMIQALDIQPSSELRADLIARLNSMIDLAQTNDMRSVYSDGHLLRDVFPDYRIPCIVHYQLNSLSPTGTAYSVLNNAEPRKSGRLRLMEVLPNSTAFRDFLQKFVMEPGWDGSLDDGPQTSENSTESD